MDLNLRDRRIDVFFYGLFMDEALLKEKGVNPLNPRRACLDNFKLVIGQRATLVPSIGQKVFGLMFSLTHGEVDLLYSESSVTTYRPEAVLAKVENGETIPALCFNLPVIDLSTPSNSAYATKLRELAIRLRLPSKYVQTIQPKKT